MVRSDYLRYVPGMTRVWTTSLVLLPLLVAAWLAPPSARPAQSDDPDSGADLIGKPAPEWTFTRWVRGPSRSVRDLRGKVVLVRWWTEGCRYCRSTLPALERLSREHKDLLVLGVFHPKPEPHEVADAHILQVARTLGFSGPIAFDRDWRTLNRYWLDGSPDRNWTSVSFLIDREGVIRWVHGGGEYHPSSDPKHRSCDLEYQGLERALRDALAEPSARASTGS
jgi:thiol-disulfide isomerase/thioredoxin